MSTFYDKIIKLSKNEKLQKYRITLFQHTNYLHKRLVHLISDMSTAALFIFFLRDFRKCAILERFISIDALTNLDWKRTSLLTEMTGNAESRLDQNFIFLQMKFNIFQAIPLNRVSHLPGHPTP